MRPITSPLQPGQQGSNIANLHQGLRLLLRNQITQPPEQLWQFIEERLPDEEQAQAYGDATAELIALFQRQFELPETHEVDEATATLLNQRLRALGAFSSVSDVVLPEINQKLNTINAHAENLNSINSKLDVLSTLREPVVPLSFSDRGTSVQDLQANLSRLNFTIPQNELSEQVFGVGTRDALLQLQTQYQLSPTGIFDDDTKIAIDRAIADFTISIQRISFPPKTSLFVKR